ncbi:MAG: hypothetical protein RI932_1860 [Pseudomonadota bacterium]|jgi:hypothetical protein
MFNPDLRLKRPKRAAAALYPSLFAFCSLLLSCKSKSDAQGDSRVAEATNESRDYFRSVLLGAINPSQSGGVELSKLMAEGTIAVVSPQTQFAMGKTIFSSLSLFTQHGIGSQTLTGGEIIRAETFSLRSSLNPGVLKYLGRSLPFNLSMGANAEIKVFRKFADANEAAKYPPYSFVELPLTIENAKSMRIGDLVVIPLDAQILGSVDGSFMRSVFHSGVSIEKLLGNSFVGHVQSGLRANLVISGRFEMHVFKTDNNLVRIRLFQQSENSASGGAGGSASAALKYTLIPFAKLHQVAEIKKVKRISFYGDKVLPLPDPLKQISARNKLAPGVVTGLDDGQLDSKLQQRNDGLLDLANAVSLSAEDIQRATTDKINAVADTLNKNLIQKINQPISELKKYSDQELRFDAQVSWNESRKQRKQFFSDYQFDLRNTLAQQAFLHAVSGASTFITTRKDLERTFSSGRAVHNYILAERLARESSSQNNPPVTRILSASARSEFSDSSFQIRAGQSAHFSLSENWKREGYQLSGLGNFEAPESASMTRWVFNQGYKFGLVTDRQGRSGGIVSDFSGESGEQPLFWISKETEARSPGGGHLGLFFVQVYNALGPLAAELKIADLYKGEVGGEFRGRLVLGFSAKALSQLFNPQIIKPEVVWRAAAQVSKSFDNTFGLPFLMFPMGLPAGLNDPAIVESCETITRQWGSFYCHYLAGQVLPALLKAQTSSKISDKLNFIESFLGQGFAANKIGTELFARIVLESLMGAKGRLEADEVAVWVVARHKNSAAPEFNPTIKYGNSGLIEAFERVLPPE